VNNYTLEENKLERITRRWWFFSLFVLIQFVPPYASKGYEWQEWGDVIYQALSHAIVYQHPQIYPIFKVIPIVLLIALFVFRNKAARLFSIYAGISYVLFAIGQGIAVTEKYGVAACTIIIVMFLVVAAFWAWEAIALQNDFRPAKIPVWRYWVVPLLLFAFWCPLNWQTAAPDFNPAYIFTNGAGLAFCMMTPVYVGLLTLYWPRVNVATLRVTSLVGLIIGLYNMHLNFIVKPDILWWNGVLHIPLLTISAYGLILSFKKINERT
jgi:hypothetical protein